MRNGCRVRRPCLRVAFYLLLLAVSSTNGAKKGSQLVERVADQKELKKLLRTKTNVLVLYASGPESDARVRPLFSECAEAAERLFGKATIAFVNCADDEAKKVCKKAKAVAKPTLLKHYQNGEEHKDYDRLPTAASIVRFLLDPTGEPPWEEDSTANDVLHLGDEAALKKLLKMDQPALIMFYAPWCGHCKRMKPEYASAATDVKAKAVLAAMDLTRPENTGVQKAFNVTAFPTLLYFENGKVKFPYGGSNTKDSLVTWINDPQPPKAASAAEVEAKWSDEPSDIHHLTDATFSPFVAEHSSVLVMFYAPWCGHCKRMKPDYADAAGRLRDVAGAALAAVDATAERQLAQQFQLQGFPTLKYFRDGQFQWDLQERTADKIVEFMQDPKQPPPPPPPEPSWAEQPSAVIHLTSDTFKSELKRRKHAIVMFYAPWCGHCKNAKPYFTEAAERFVGDPKVAFCAIDCTQHTPDCDQYGVNGYPTFLYFSYLKQSEPYQKGHMTEDFVEFIADKGGEVEAREEDATPPPPTEPPAKEAAAFFGAAVRVATAADFATVTASADAALVMFYAPWCGHCKKAKEEVSAAAAAIDDAAKAAVVAVDCANDADFCKQLGVKGYPTFHVYKKGAFDSAYTGARTSSEFLAALSVGGEQAKPAAKEPVAAAAAAESFFAEQVTTAASVESLNALLAASDRALVMFYAPWCGHCKNAKPAVNEAAAALGDSAREAIVAVDCTAAKELCREHGVKGFPTFKLFEKGVFKTDYKDRRTADRKEEEAKVAEEAFFSAAVHQATADTFAQLTTASERALVMFYAPWCGHCKNAKPAVNEVAAALTDAPKAAIIAVDCTKHSALCKENDVKGYPTFQLFEQGSFVSKYTGERSAKGFLSALQVGSPQKTEL